MQYETEHYNVLMPTQSIQQVSPWHAARTSIVVIDPNPDKGDVYKVGSRYDDKGQKIDLYGLSKPALMKIAAAAGIVWNWRESGPISLSKDYVCYKAVGAIRLPDGSWQPITATKEIDLTVIEEEQREANVKKAYEYAGDPKKAKWLGGLQPEEWAERQTRSAMIQWRKNKLMRAETGAMLRVIRAALGMRSQYTLEELKKPFVVPRIDFSPDYSDEAVRRALIQNGIQAIASLFGQAAPIAALPSTQAFTSTRSAFEAPDDVEEEIPESEPANDTRVEESEKFDEPQMQEDSTDTPEPPEEPQAEQMSGGTLFNDVPPETTQGSRSTQTTTKPGATAAHCAECGKGITEKVLQYSQKQFGRPLCYSCQGKAKGGTQA